MDQLMAHHLHQYINSPKSQYVTKLPAPSIFHGQANVTLWSEWNRSNGQFTVGYWVGTEYAVNMQIEKNKYADNYFHGQITLLETPHFFMNKVCLCL